MKEKSTIALVDDERNILTSLGMALEAEGYKVRCGAIETDKDAVDLIRMMLRTRSRRIIIACFSGLHWTC